jgi:hypothetical protein
MFFPKKVSPSDLLAKSALPERVFDVVDIGRRNEFHNPVGYFDELGRYHYTNPVQEAAARVVQKIQELVG